MKATRREFLAMAGSTAALALLAPGRAQAIPLGIEPGVQLWAARDDLTRDFAGTLRALSEMGYRRVEAAGWQERSAADFRAAVTDAGLDCVSGHYSLGDLMEGTEAKLDFAREVGVRFCVASSPAPSRAMEQGKPWAVAMAEAMTLADWRSNAEAMNRMGALARERGLRFAYHNHAAEFLDYEGVVAFHEIERLTDPALVEFELDIGWVAAAGLDPVHALERHGARTRLLHIKDQTTPARDPGHIAADLRTVPIGQGTIDWPAVFAAAARHAQIDSWFVEQEPPYVQPPLDMLRASLAYLDGLSA